MKELLELATKVATTEIENQKLKTELEKLKHKKESTKLTDYFNGKELEVAKDMVIRFDEMIENNDRVNSPYYDDEIRVILARWIEIRKDKIKAEQEETD